MEDFDQVVWERTRRRERVCRIERLSGDLLGLERAHSSRASVRPYVWKVGGRV